MPNLDWNAEMVATAAEVKNKTYSAIMHIYAKETNQTTSEVKELMDKYSAKNKRMRLVTKLARHRYYNGDYYDE